MIFFTILGVILILCGAIWLALFHIRKQKFFEDYADRRLSEYQDEDIVPDEVARQLLSDGVELAIRTAIIHTVLPILFIFGGIALWIIGFILFEH